MTKGGCRLFIRRRLNERLPDDLNDLEIDTMMSEALKLVQKRVVAVDAYAFVEIAYSDTVVGTAGEFYDAPPGMWYPFEVNYKSSSSAAYVRLVKKGYHEIREASDTASPRYARYGRYFAVWPNPTVAVAQGLRIHYMPTLSIGDPAVDNDDIELPVHPALHMAVVVWAVMLAMGETMESRTELATELATYLNDIPEWYHAGGDPQVLRIDTGKVARQG